MTIAVIIGMLILVLFCIFAIGCLLHDNRANEWVIPFFIVFVILWSVGVTHLNSAVWRIWLVDQGQAEYFQEENGWQTGWRLKK